MSRISQMSKLFATEGGLSWSGSSYGIFEKIWKVVTKNFGKKC